VGLAAYSFDLLGHVQWFRRLLPAMSLLDSNKKYSYNSVSFQLAVILFSLTTDVVAIEKRKIFFHSVPGDSAG
jgi:hypothetical protein